MYLYLFPGCEGYAGVHLGSLSGVAVGVGAGGVCCWSGFLAGALGDAPGAVAGVCGFLGGVAFGFGVGVGVAAPLADCGCSAPAGFLFSTAGLEEEGVAVPAAVAVPDGFPFALVPLAKLPVVTLPVATPTAGLPAGVGDFTGAAPAGATFAAAPVPVEGLFWTGFVPAGFG